mmetsp:Transcript_99404/g.191982  ORF Transcript_99404/g.191982 Transcript_99404/m.191982 type:complete len:209 (+) Transcript_99404:954-1580(+)
MRCSKWQRRGIPKLSRLLRTPNDCMKKQITKLIGLLKPSVPANLSSNMHGSMSSSSSSSNSPCQQSLRNQHGKLVQLSAVPGVISARRASLHCWKNIAHRLSTVRTSWNGGSMLQGSILQAVSTLRRWTECGQTTRRCTMGSTMPRSKGWSGPLTNLAESQSSMQARTRSWNSAWLQVSKPITRRLTFKGCSLVSRIWLRRRRSRPMA